jgi:multidrug efflux system membrane fusion protein
VSRQDLDVSVAKEGVSLAEVRKAEAAIERAKLDLGYTKITAPITGKISRAHVDVGSLVNAGGGDQLLTTITSMDPIYVYFSVDEQALGRYLRDPGRNADRGKDGQVGALKERNIQFQLGLESEEGYPHKGVLDFVDNKVNPSTGTIQVRGELPNTAQLFAAGMRARVRLPVGKLYEALLITERAVGNDQNRKFVYVVNDQNIAERRDVKLGRLSDRLQVVREGLKREDRVIVNGIQRVRDGAKVEPRPGDMPDAPADQANKKAKS